MEPVLVWMRVMMKGETPPKAVMPAQQHHTSDRGNQVDGVGLDQSTAYHASTGAPLESLHMI